MVSRLRHIAELKQKRKTRVAPSLIWLLWDYWVTDPGHHNRSDIEYQRIDVDSADGWLKFKKDFGIDWMYEKSKIDCAMNHLPQLIRVQDYIGTLVCIKQVKYEVTHTTGSVLKRTETVWSDKKW